MIAAQEKQQTNMTAQDTKQEKITLTLIPNPNPNPHPNPNPKTAGHCVGYSEVMPLKH